MPDTIRILIADDHPIVRQGLRQIIEREAGLAVIGESGDGAEALDSIRALRPDVVILDIDMPRLGGFDVLSALQDMRDPSRAIMLTVHREEKFFREAVRLGARGYVLKDSAVTDIVNCIRAVAQGHSYVSPALTSYLLGRDQTGEGGRGLEQLTPAERSVLRLIAEYRTNVQIAAELCISPHTVKTHRRNINAKLGLQGSHALMKFALEHKAEL